MNGSELDGLAQGQVPDGNARKNVPPPAAGALNSFDVFSLICNKMIGTGIFTAPASVLLTTRNKSLALGLWAIGFAWAIMSMFIYLEYAAVLPYTGGELVYIDEITASKSVSQIIPPDPAPLSMGRASPGSSRRLAFTRLHTSSWFTKMIRKLRQTFSRFLGDGLLAYVTYAVLFVTVFNTGTNCMQVGREVLIAISPDSDPDRDLIRFIGVFVLSMICLLQYFSAGAGRALNRALAVLKVLMLFVLLVAGGVSASLKDGPSDFTKNEPGFKPIDGFQALLIVLFSYEGWENANFVAGEITHLNQNALRNGFFAAVFVVGSLYLCLNAVFLAAISYDDILNVQTARQQFNYPALFFHNTVAAQRVWAILIALSAVGNINTVIYTFSRVKQAIGQANIFPWSSLWKQDSPESAPVLGSQTDTFRKTPKGGLMLEWIFTVVEISFSSAIPATLDSINFPGNLQTYAHCFILIILSLGIFRLNSRQSQLRAANPDPLETPRVRYWRITRFWWPFSVPPVFFYVALNSFILWGSAEFDSTSADNPTYSLRGKIYPEVVLSLVVVGMAYYFFTFAGAEKRPAQHRIYNWSIINWGGVTCKVDKDGYYDAYLERVYRFGRRRVIKYTIREANRGIHFLYWVFGGTMLRKTPWDRMEETWDDIKRTIRGWGEAFKDTFGRTISR